MPIPDPIHSVAIVGGTHGNEITGPHLLRHWRRHPQEVARGSFETQLRLGNPKAFAANRRYIDHDLNRSFTEQNLRAHDSASYEAQRAALLNQGLGPRGASRTDLLIDLHTSTSNCAAMIILLDTDPFSLRMAAYVSQRIAQTRIHLIAQAEGEPKYLGSIARHSLGVEVGPVAQGILRSDIYELSRRIVLAALDFVHAHNQGLALDLPPTIEVFRLRETLPLPAEDGYCEAIVHEALQDRDYEALRPGAPLFRKLDGTVVTFDGAETRYPVFINEAAYYEGGIAMMLTSKETLAVPDATR